MTAEEAHEIGRVGVMNVKQFLESTTYLQMPWTAYDHGQMCKLQRTDGSKKQYDLRGYFLGQRRRNLFVESKKYNSPGSQGSMYRQFLADVHSIVAKLRADEMDDGSEFMWITWHPFSQGDWPNLTSHEYVKASVALYPELMGQDSSGVEFESTIDEELCRDIAQRLWVIVLSDRQYDLVMSPGDIRQALASLDREGA